MGGGAFFAGLASRMSARTASAIAATDIANAGVPLKVGMSLTAHKTVTMFMRYIHNEEDPVRMAADAVAARMRIVSGGKAEVADDASAEMEMEVKAAETLETAPWHHLRPA